MENKIEKLSEIGDRAEAIRRLEELPGLAENEEMLVRLGELLYADGKTTEALNKFNAVVRLHPENRKAANYIAMINGILDYYCKDLLNP